MDMTDEPETQTQAQAPDEAPAAGTSSVRRALPRWLTRHTRRVIIVVTAIVAAILVSAVTIDLGPAMRTRAEQVASTQIERQVHIGRLGTYLLPGRFLVEDLVIEGLSPGDEPFFTSDQIVISVSWLALLRGEILVDADMGNWRMLVESFPGGRHSFPRLTGDEDEPSDEATDEAASEAERWIVTTVNYLRAHHGEFTFRDHGAPWNVIARNIDLTLSKTEGYSGEVSLTNGTVEIGSFEPMTMDMRARFELDGSFVDLTHVDLTLDGFEAALNGEVDLFNWPEQTYHVVESDVDLATMKDVFFAQESFAVGGAARFIGTWHIFDGGRELTGSFQSDTTTLNDLVFSGLDGALVWTTDRFEVFEGSSGLYDGELDFGFSMKPLGAEVPGIATLETTYRDVEIAAVVEALALAGARPAGRATGTNLLRWPLGKFDDLTGKGRLTIAPADGVVLMTQNGLDATHIPSVGYAAVPFAGEATPWQFPVGGEITYTVDPEWIEIAPSWLATPQTAIRFDGRTAFGDRSRIPFTVASADWQESDRLMASILTAFGSPTGDITLGGRGRLDGVMLGAFSAPRIEARFTGEDIRAWNVEWGSGTGVITVENGYLDVEDGLFAQGPAQLHVGGRFALGSPRLDGGEEISARFDMVSFSAGRVRDAFGLEGYDVDGLLTGEIRLFGNYTSPFGFGRLTLDNPVAYGEPFDTAAACLRFEGDGVRIDGLDVRKGEGQVTGAAFIGWDGTYSFNADGRDIEMASIESVRYAQVPLVGLARFTASGVGAFVDPRYEVRGSIADLVVSNEPVGQVTGRVDVRDGVMGLEVEAASPQLAISGSGRVDLTQAADSELLFRFTNTTLDPYIRAFQPDLPPDLSAVVSGTLRVNGELRNLEQLVVDATVEQLDLDFFDYRVRNDGSLSFGLYDNVVVVEQMRLVGDGTAIELTGQIGLSDDRVALTASGDAGLGILQGFFPDVRSSGNARLVADIGGTIRQPVITGEAAVDDGRIRHLALPHGLERINGRIVFEPDGVRFDDLAGEIGGGPVRFGGRFELRGYEVGDLGITLVGTGMQLRFPEGVRSVIDAELTLGGEVTDPVLSGTVNVRDAIWLELFQPSTGLIDFTPEPEILAPQLVEPTLPLRLDVRILAPSTIGISDNTARVAASAELTLGGTYDQPLLFGNAEIDRGEVFFEGNRYRITRGSISFANPTEFEPFFDIEAETDVRVPGQTYRVTLGVVGTTERLDFELSSDPPLPEFEILGMLLGDVRDPQAAELRSLRAQEASRQELLQAGAARLLTSPLSSGVGRVVQESFGVDTFQITPSLGDLSAQQSAQLLPTARVLIGKRISDRAHVTVSRTLTGTNQDIIVVLEYDQTDRLSWVLSQNEDRTYALDFRMRHTF